jgi:hypothetical protein
LIGKPAWSLIKESEMSLFVDRLWPVLTDAVMVIGHFQADAGLAGWHEVCLWTIG